jgi:hypothetical protein
MFTLCISFYPGFALPTNPQISDSDKPAGSIEAPEFDRKVFESSSARAGAPDGRAVRATRVVGSLNHAVLPMPPVCGPFEKWFGRWALDAMLCLAKDNDTRRGFPLVLRNCSQ